MPPKKLEPNVRDPNCKQAIIIAARAPQWVDFFDRGIAHHLLDNIDRRQYDRESDYINPGQRVAEMRYG
jgi:hypothetical protein